METEFEKGRQDALNELEKILTRRLKYVADILEETENMAYSKEKKQGIHQTYKEVLEDIKTLKQKATLINRYANGNSNRLA